MVALTGTEILQVVPLQSNGQPGAIFQQITTQDIANLATVSDSSLVVTALNTVGAGTITAAGIVNQVVARGGAQSSTPFTDTTATAAQIIAAMPSGTPVGVAFKFTYQNNTNANATITGGTGVTVSGFTVVPAYSWAEYVVTYSAANTITMVGIETGANFETLPIVNTAISTVGAGTLTAAGLVGQVITRSGSVAAYTDTTDTATNIIAAMPNTQIGQSFIVEIKNTVAFAETITGGTGVTVSGISIVPPNSVGRFLVTYTAAATATMVGLGNYQLANAPIEVITALSTVGAGTITAAGIAGGVTNRTGSTAAFTDTTDTAANIIAARPNIAIGSSFEYLYYNNTAGTATITGGTGVTVSGLGALVPQGSYARFLVTYTAAATITMVGIMMGPLGSLPAAQFVTGTTTTTFAAGQLTGAGFVNYTNTQGTPGSIATRTATQMIADIPNAYVGQTWLLRITNGQGTGTLTVTAGTDVTLTGTATIAVNTWRDFVCTITSVTAHTITMQNIATGTFS